MNNLIKRYPEHAALLRSLNKSIINDLQQVPDLDKKLRDTQFRVKLMFLNCKTGYLLPDEQLDTKGIK